MTADTGRWSLADLLDLFEVRTHGSGRFTAETGQAGVDERQVDEGPQLLPQVIIAVAQRLPGESVRSAPAVFARAVTVRPPVELGADVVAEGRSTATAVVTATQNGRRCVTVTVPADVPSPDVIRHRIPRPDVAGARRGEPGADADERPRAAVGRCYRRQQSQRHSGYGLSGEVSSADSGRTLAVAQRMRTGNVTINTKSDFGITRSAAPKQGGLGRRNGAEGFLEYLESKTIGMRK